MTVVSLGDMAQQFTASRNGNAIKSNLFTLTNELSSGRVADVTQALNGETTRFSGLRHTLAQLDGYLQVGTETRQMLGNVQIALEKVDGTRGALAERLLRINDTSTAAQIDEAAVASRAGFAEIVSALNTKVADRALLGGARVDAPPLADADTMLADIIGAVGGATDAPAIVAAVDGWFNDPAGGFATLGYQGDTGPPLTRRITEDMAITVNARADDAAVKDVLQGAVLATLANDLAGLDQGTRAILLKDAAVTLFGAASDLAAVQARVGFEEAGVARAMTEATAQQSALRIAQNDIVLADPFETASRLQATQLQLETFFSVTARMSQLSLLRYI